MENMKCLGDPKLLNGSVYIHYIYLTFGGGFNHISQMKAKDLRMDLASQNNNC